MCVWCVYVVSAFKNLSLLQQMLRPIKCFFFSRISPNCIECVHEIRTIDLDRKLDLLGHIVSIRQPMQMPELTEIEKGILSDNQVDYE